jgi:hypothetical protein
MVAGGPSLVVAPGASAMQPTRAARAHECDGKQVKVPAGTAVDGEEVDPGSYRLVVKGISCGKARKAIVAAIDGKAVLAGFEADPETGGAVELRLIRGQDTEGTADDALIILAKEPKLSGSTVTFVNKSPLRVRVVTNTGVDQQLDPGGQVTVSRNAATVATDVVIKTLFDNYLNVFKTQSCVAAFSTTPQWGIYAMYSDARPDFIVDPRGVCTYIGGDIPTCYMNNPTIGKSVVCFPGLSNPNGKVELRRDANNGTYYNYTIIWTGWNW